MTRYVVVLVMVPVFLAGCISVHETKRVCEDPPAETTVVAQMDAPAQVLRHVVILKFKEGTSAADIRKVETAFCALPTRIETIYDFEWGTDVSVESRQKGFTHCFVVTFLSEADRAVYLPHPAHEEFGAVLGPHLDDVLVLDYWAN